mgnify:CR=1 FL=1
MVLTSHEEICLCRIATGSLNCCNPSLLKGVTYTLGLQLQVKVPVREAQS